MNASDNVNTIRALYEAFGRADVATMLDAVTEDVDWATGGQQVPPPGTGSGRARRRWRRSSATSALRSR